MECAETFCLGVEQIAMEDPPPGPPGLSHEADEPVPFWRKPLEALTPPEWESLCDGCGKCCLVKLEDEDTGQVHFTSIGCRLLDPVTCQCSNYPGRQSIVTDCIKLTPAIVRSVTWLPRTCAYRLVAEGQDLPGWHPLKTGSRESVHEAGISTRGRLGPPEEEVALEDLPDYIVTWPMRGPRRRRSSRNG